MVKTPKLRRASSTLCPVPRAPSTQLMPPLGPQVCKCDLLWAIWNPGVCGYSDTWLRNYGFVRSVLASRMSLAPAEAASCRRALQAWRLLNRRLSGLAGSKPCTSRQQFSVSRHLSHGQNSLQENYYIYALYRALLKELLGLYIRSFDHWLI